MFKNFGRYLLEVINGLDSSMVYTIATQNMVLGKGSFDSSEDITKCIKLLDAEYDKQFGIRSYYAITGLADYVSKKHFEVSQLDNCVIHHCVNSWFGRNIALEYRSNMGYQIKFNSDIVPMSQDLCLFAIDKNGIGLYLDDKFIEIGHYTNMGFQYFMKDMRARFGNNKYVMGYLSCIENVYNASCIDSLYKNIKYLENIKKDYIEHGYVTQYNLDKIIEIAKTDRLSTYTQSLLVFIENAVVKDEYFRRLGGRIREKSLETILR